MITGEAVWSSSAGPKVLAIRWADYRATVAR